MDVNNTAEEMLSLSSSNTPTAANIPRAPSSYSRSLSLDQQQSLLLDASARRRLVQSNVAALALCLAGWYYPRYLNVTETTIATKVPPYQQTAAGDIILDFALNEPLVDPPTIPCKYKRQPQYCCLLLFILCSQNLF